MTHTKRSFRALLLLGTIATQAVSAVAQATPAANPQSAVAYMIDAQGHKVGTVKFADTPKGLTIKGNVSGLPAGTHGMHIHAVGRCEQPEAMIGALNSTTGSIVASGKAPVAPDFATAGDIFNPTNMHHGANNLRGPELGDLQNVRIVADADATGVLGTATPSGSGSINQTVKGVTLTGPNGILGPNGASLVIHAYQDDYKTDPEGNAGDRIACGVITLESR